MNGVDGANFLSFHRRSKNCDPAVSPLAAQKHCHCQECLVLSLPSVRWQQRVLMSESKACLVSSFWSELLACTHIET